MEKIFENKNALVTGGAGGIGLAISKKLSEYGARIIMIGRNEHKGAAAVKEIKSSGGDAVFIGADLGDRNSLLAAAEQVTTSFGGVDILINNAALSGFMGPVTDTPLADYDAVMQVNLTAPFQLCQAFVPVMAEKGFGRIINISSVATRVTPANTTSYNISKAGMDALTRSLSREVASKGITVNSIAPGLVLTDRIKNQRIPGLAASTGASEDQVLNQMKSKADTKELTTESEIAELVFYLASPAARNLTGEVINIAGGF